MIPYLPYLIVLDLAEYRSFYRLLSYPSLILHAGASSVTLLIVFLCLRRYPVSGYVI